MTILQMLEEINDGVKLSVISLEEAIALKNKALESDTSSCSPCKTAGCGTACLCKCHQEEPCDHTNRTPKGLNLEVCDCGKEFCPIEFHPLMDERGDR